MFEQPWQLWVILGTLVLYALLLVQFARMKRERADRTEPPEPDPIEESGIEGSGIEEPKVLCPDCGAANEQGYRFCRSCIGELPQSGGFERDGDNPLIRETR